MDKRNFNGQDHSHDQHAPKSQNPLVAKALASQQLVTPDSQKTVESVSQNQQSAESHQNQPLSQANQQAAYGQYDKLSEVTSTSESQHSEQRSETTSIAGETTSVAHSTETVPAEPIESKTPVTNVDHESQTSVSEQPQSVIETQVSSETKPDVQSETTLKSEPKSQSNDNSLLNESQPVQSVETPVTAHEPAKDSKPMTHKEMKMVQASSAQSIQVKRNQLGKVLGVLAVLIIAVGVYFGYQAITPQPTHQTHQENSSSATSKTSSSVSNAQSDDNYISSDITSRGLATKAGEKKLKAFGQGLSALGNTGQTLIAGQLPVATNEILLSKQDAQRLFGKANQSAVGRRINIEVKVPTDNGKTETVTSSIIVTGITQDKHSQVPSATLDVLYRSVGGTYAE